ncbi:hypothetical protein [Methylocystis echinoides]|uniref:Secreted protein n=1 Tax=Methylocystis echinoides TaxID=29468 RepID=A0A9W6GQF3_9HYPH|nr:hypothetical protein [Methylocystis echinoides]GLI91015.1 hypothetical protein LMG27198_00070 [Methylocystis echinoides]
MAAAIQLLLLLMLAGLSHACDAPPWDAAPCAGAAAVATTPDSAAPARPTHAAHEVGDCCVALCASIDLPADPTHSPDIRLRPGRVDAFSRPLRSVVAVAREWAPGCPRAPPAV